MIHIHAVCDGCGHKTNAINPSSRGGPSDDFVMMVMREGGWRSRRVVTKHKMPAETFMDEQFFDYCPACVKAGKHKAPKKAKKP